MTLVAAVLVVLLACRVVITAAIVDRVAIVFATQFHPDLAAHFTRRRQRAP